MTLQEKVYSRENKVPIREKTSLATSVEIQRTLFLSRLAIKPRYIGTIFSFNVLKCWPFL